jgi:hypothetical protein
VILTNGARLYVDHAHPEYSSPEVTGPRDAVLWDKAGELIMARAAVLAAQIPRSSPDHAVQEQHRQQGRLLRHARELPDARETSFASIVRHLTPFFVSRQVVCGSGRVGIGQDGASTGSRSASGPTSSRSRSASRRRSSARSSTPATSRTPTPRSTAGCT